MVRSNTRRHFLKSSLSAAALGSVAFLHQREATAQAPVRRTGDAQIKLSLNAYSFNRPLRDGSVTLMDLLDFCAQQGFEAIDPTGYYFPGYPQVPTDGYINEFKRKAFLLGLDISGTGVRNDFTQPDKGKRQQDIRLVKAWIEAAAKMGAPVLRVFSGHGVPDGKTWDEVAKWMVDDLGECLEHGKKYGVMITLQNHNDFLKTAAETLTLMNMISSDWLGLMLDIGSLRTADPYEEIAQLVPYAVTWQFKEHVYIKGQETPTDIARVFRIIKDAKYRGYVPLETLGAGDPFVKVPNFLQRVRQALA